MPRTLELLQTFELENCCNCGVAFAIPADMVRVLRETHRTFYCPNGHGQSYTAETQAERLAREFLKAKDAYAEQFRLQLLAEREQRERIQKRIGAGVCTCCNRTFQNLKRHMATKHAIPPAEVKQLT